ncbi:MAG TPA: hypothetical protein PLQ09_07445 [Prolixibacteraceae bacterium]|nr:hypothetical protein [Prolixibacteraceae bacterium]HQN93936.1 hypothetical protein [Prolixibacteraceae bacterium]
MNERKLTEEEIDQLFAICENHEVKYFDVQIELVDHIACIIEAKWSIEPQLSFDEALFIVLKQFGVDPLFHASYGSLLTSPFPKLILNKPSVFEEIKKSKEKELIQKYARIQRKYIAEFFKLPKIILTISIVFILFLVYKIAEDNQVVTLVLQGSFLVVSVAFSWLIFPKFFKIELSTSHKFLLIEYFKSTRYSILSIAVFSSNLIYLVGRLRSLAGLSLIGLELLLAILATFLGIVVYVIGVYTPKRIKEDFENKFPQFCIH